MAEPIPDVHAINAALLDIEGAGQYLNLTPRHVRDLAYRRELAVVKVGRKGPVPHLRSGRLHRSAGARGGPVNFDNEEGAAPKERPWLGMLRPPVYAVAPPMVWCTDQLARAMDVGLLTERQARTAGEPRLAPDGRAQPLMFGTVECWDAIVRGDRRGFGKRGGGRPDDDDHRGADDDGARSEDACQEGPPEYCADDAARHDDTAD